uniref:AlNc14C174G8081 protein n=1 Tax=Albugo laibachii Nc14 TaxID=890382 RepID=F0WNR9_9STRA|nr:AlNc14C174G8081 [Albugo laibachii Nc14]|eukprot:CCA22961.1 AlNc14C174G8081 [Albugo laibachii Nc14]
MVACVSADGFVVSPAFIVPGKRLNRDVLDACTISGAKITTSEAGFMNTCIMREYIAAFALAVPLPTKRLLILVLDGASSHLDASIDAAVATYGVRLVQLPPNANHLYQPLDVAVFRAVKTILKERMYSFMIATGKTAMTKKEAVHLASTAWRMGIEVKAENIAAGFEEAGIRPLSLPMMLRRLKNFKENDSKAQQPLPSWLVTQQVIRNEILVLPPTPEKKGWRKAVDVKRRLLTQDDLRNE